MQPDGESLYRSEGGCDGTDNIWNHAEESTLALTDLGKIDALIDDFDEMAAAMNAIVRDEAFSDHIADLGYAISRSAGSQNLDNLLDVYEYAESIMALYTDADSNLYQHQSMHEECQALFRAAGKVSDYIAFDDEETNAASEDNSGALLFGTGDNPVLYRGKGAQAARGGISVFGPVLSSQLVDNDSDKILNVYKDCELKDAVLKNYNAFIPSLKSRKEDVGSFTGNMKVLSETDGDDLVLTMQVKPRSTGVSVVDVRVQVDYTDLSAGQTYRLGEMPVQSNRREMEFTNAFDGTWKAVGSLDDDGPSGETLCTMNIESDGSVYRIPAYVDEDGKRVPALVSASHIASMVDACGETTYLRIPGKGGYVGETLCKRDKSPGRP